MRGHITDVTRCGQSRKASERRAYPSPLLTFGAVPKRIGTLCGLHKLRTLEAADILWRGCRPCAFLRRLRGQFVIRRPFVARYKCSGGHAMRVARRTGQICWRWRLQTKCKRDDIGLATSPAGAATQRGVHGRPRKSTRLSPVRNGKTIGLKPGLDLFWATHRVDHLYELSKLTKTSHVFAWMVSYRHEKSSNAFIW